MQKVKRIISEELKEEMTISHQVENTNKEIKKKKKITNRNLSKGCKLGFTSEKWLMIWYHMTISIDLIFNKITIILW